jgi:hypothetical protein
VIGIDIQRGFADVNSILIQVWSASVGIAGRNNKAAVATVVASFSPRTVPVALGTLTVPRGQVTTPLAPMATLPSRTSVVADKASTQGHTLGNTAGQTKSVHRPDSVAAIAASEANGVHKPEVVPRRRWQRRKIGHRIPFKPYCDPIPLDVRKTFKPSFPGTRSGTPGAQASRLGIHGYQLSREDSRISIQLRTLVKPATPPGERVVVDSWRLRGRRGYGIGCVPTAPILPIALCVQNHMLGSSRWV